MMSDEECIKMLAKYWYDFFALPELTEKEIKEIEAWTERFPDKPCPIIKRREEHKQKRINNFTILATDAVKKGEGELIGKSMMNHNGGEGYELKLTLTKVPFTPEQQKKHFGRE